ncbi:MAG: beta-propeller fold lactonase family protein [Vulcanimicrobiota bacterium]
MLIRVANPSPREVLAQTLGIDRVRATLLIGDTIVYQVDRPVNPGETAVRITFPSAGLGTFTLRAEGFSGSQLIASDQRLFSVGSSLVLTVTLELDPSGLLITPATFSLNPGGTRQLTASRGQTPVTAAWDSDTPNVASVDGNGLVTAHATGMATITATEGEDMATAVVTVTTSAVIDHLAVSPSSFTLTLGDTQQLTATLFYSDESSEDVTNQVSWMSLNPTAAMVSPTGLVSTVEGGMADIQATLGDQQAMATVNVIDPNSPLAYLLVTNPTPNGGGGAITSFEVAQDGTLSVVQNQSNSGRPFGIAATSDGGFVYTMTASARDISTFSFDRNSGMLTPVGSPLASHIGDSPRRLIVDPTDQFIYFSNFFSGVGGFTINPDGTPSANNFAAISQGASRGGFDFTFNQSGDVMYAPNGDVDSITVFDVNQTTGTLSFLNSETPHFPVDAGDLNPAEAVLSRDGNFLFVANFDSDNVRSYPIGSMGELMNGGNTAATDPEPRRLALHPGLDVLYVATSMGSIQSFTVAAGGQLTPLGTSLTINTSPRKILIDPSGQFLYTVASNDTIDAFSISATGELTFLQTYNFNELSFPSDAILIPYNNA